MQAMIKNTQGDIEFLSACPGCHSETLTVLVQESERKIYITDADEMIVTFGVCGCEQCGLTFLNPRMGPRKLFEYYAKQSRIPRLSIKHGSPFALLMEIQIDVIEKYKPIKKGMRILEIGCAEGFFMQALQNRTNEKLELYGVELSEKYIEHAKKLLPEMVVFQTPLENIEFGDKTFDLIVLRHVFEHLSNPMECLKKIRSILTLEGLLYIEVPDSEKVNTSISHFYHHEHLLYFTPQILNSYLAANGFQSLLCNRFEDNPIGSGFSYPVIQSLSKVSTPNPLENFPGYAKSIYIENDALNVSFLDSILGPVRQRLNELKIAKKTIGLFGAGPHTMDFLKLMESETIHWSKIFDNNPSKQGKFMLGIPIVKPDENTLITVDCILISSQEFEMEMVEQIRSLVDSNVEIITIYNRHDS